MKIANLICAGLLLVSNLLIAQQTKKSATKNTTKLSAEQRVEKWFSTVSPKLNLTDEQAPKLKALMIERAKLRDELRTKYGKDKQGIQNELKTTRATYATSLKSILSPEQMKQLRGMNKGRKANKPMKNKKGDSNNMQESEDDELSDMID